MPDVYKVGLPHKPMTTVTGHFLGMQPIDVVDHKPTEEWYRADEMVALIVERDEWRKQAGIGVQSQFEQGKAYEQRIVDLEKKIADLEAQVARRPPKRAGIKSG
jgi:hypothetical protein